MKELKVPSRSLCDALAVDLKNPASYFPIEKICKILYTEYSYDDLTGMEAEFILEHILKHHPEIDQGNIDSKFIEKLYAIPAILNKPMLVTESLLAFYNTVMVCNDVPAGVTEVEDITNVPARFINRALLAVNAMLPDNIRFDELYLYPNVARWIFDMYKADDEVLLPPVLEHLQEDYLESTFAVSQAKEYRSIIDEIKPGLNILTDTLSDTIVGKKGYVAEDNPILLSDNDGDLSGLQVKLFKNDYYKKEKEYLTKYAEESYTGRAARKYLLNMAYTYAYSYLNTGMNNRRMLVAVDLDSYPKDRLGLGLFLATKLKSTLDYLSLIDTTEVHIFSDKYGESDVKEIRDFLPSDTKVVFNKLKYRDSRLTAISDWMYNEFGPPSRLIILSNKNSSKPDTDFAKEADYRKKSGWNVSVLS